MLDKTLTVQTLLCTPCRSPFDIDTPTVDVNKAERKRPELVEMRGIHHLSDDFGMLLAFQILVAERSYRRIISAVLRDGIEGIELALALSCTTQRLHINSEDVVIHMVCYGKDMERLAVIEDNRPFDPLVSLWKRLIEVWIFSHGSFPSR